MIRRRKVLINLMAIFAFVLTLLIIDQSFLASKPVFPCREGECPFDMTCHPFGATGSQCTALNKVKCKYSYGLIEPLCFYRGWGGFLQIAINKGLGIHLTARMKEVSQ